MPPTAGQLSGEGVPDLGIVLQMLKKCIIFIPLVIMAGILMIPKLLVYPDKQEETVKNNISLIVGEDPTLHGISSEQQLTVTTNNASNANFNLTFKEYFLTLNSENNTNFPT